MANVVRERAEDPRPPAAVGASEPVISNEGTDPYDATVERLLAVLEENQAAIAALAQAWRHKSRALEVTQAELAQTLEALAAERVRCETAC